MAGWRALIYIVASATGAVMFLALVANELAAREAALERLDEKQRKAWERRKAMAAGEEPITVEAV